MRIKIISNGHVTGTQIIDTETGSIVENVTRIEWDMSADPSKLATAKVTFEGIPVEIESDICEQADN